MAASKTSLAHSFFIRNNAKLWTNIAYVVATWVVIHQEMRDKGVDSTILFVWLGTVAGAEIAKRIVSGTMGVTTEEPK